MAGDDLFKRYLEIGASVLGMSRERAERIVADLVASGEVARGQATKAADWLVERGKTGSEEIAELIRREIREQMSAVGVATKDDIARLEAQIEALRSAPPPAAKPASKPRARTTKSAPAGTKPAGVTRSPASRTRPGAASSSEPGAAPPAGGADPAKG